MTDNKDPFDLSQRKLFDTGFFIVSALCVISGTAVWVLQGKAAFISILLQDLGFALLILPKVAGGIVLASALGLLLPKKRVIEAVGPESGIRGLVIAACAGAIIPGGPSVTFPLAAGLLAGGADIGAAVAMISGWVLLGVNRTLIWELSFMPLDFVALRILLSLPIPILIGLVARALFKSKSAAL